MDNDVVHSDAGILSGTPVFVGTRVPARSLSDYLADGHSLDEFLEDFPTVSREQAVAFLEQSSKQFLAAS
jgi:uncharacterized protein (DUF433 family)